ncbi:MAG: WYL domain-containing protein [Bacteroidales bacterium]|nr:WYL domain-containing protein [Bacteroidales bacterium]
MSKRESISRYSLIINKLRKYPATFEEIQSYLDLESEIQGYNFNISLRTFQRDLIDIRTIYKIDIRFDRIKKMYYIDFDEKDDISERILEAFDTFNALNISDRLSSEISFEKRRPMGTENFMGLLHAIKNKKQIEFSYCKYWDEVVTLRIAEPYALKEFNNRWYVLALDHKDKSVKTFALDRLSNLEISRKNFIYPTDFNIVNYFRNCFGIITPDKGQKVEEIILSFDAFQGKYIKSMPLHHTQEILNDTDKELRIKLKLYITHDLFMELLSYGASVEVLSPPVLIEMLSSAYSKASDLYAPTCGECI